MKYKTEMKIRIILSLLLILIPVLVIFGFSSQPGNESYNLSSKFSLYIAKKWNDIFALDLNESSFNVLVSALYKPTRKLAHIIEYTWLGIFSYAAICTLQRRVKFSGIFLTIAVIIIIASLDETHQMFVANRGSHLSDVCIDVISGFLGMYLFVILKDLFRRIRMIFKKRR